MPPNPETLPWSGRGYERLWCVGGPLDGQLREIVHGADTVILYDPDGRTLYQRETTSRGDVLRGPDMDELNRDELGGFLNWKQCSQPVCQQKRQCWFWRCHVDGNLSDPVVTVAAREKSPRQR